MATRKFLANLCPNTIYENENENVQPFFPNSNLRKKENWKGKTSNHHPKNLSLNAYYF